MWTHGLSFVFVLAVAMASFSPALALPPPTHTNDIQPTDPYRWLETDSKARLEWIRSQNRDSKAYLKERRARVWAEKYFKTLISISNPEASEIAKSGDATILLVEEGLGKSHRFEKKAADGKIQVLFDTMEEKKNGSIALSDWSLSPDERYLVIATTANGSIDDHTLLLIDLTTGERIGKIERSPASDLVWLSHDEFAYVVRLDRDALSLKHKIGRSWDDDTLFSKDPSATPSNKTLDGQPWVFVTTDTGTRLRPLDSEKWYSTEQSLNRLAGKAGQDIYFFSYGEKKTGRIEKLHLDDSGSNLKSEVVVSETPMPLRSLSLQDNHLVLRYQMGATNKIVITTLSGKQKHSLVTPTCCSISGLRYDGTKDQLEIDFVSPINSKTLIYDFASRSYPESNPEITLMQKNGITYVTEVVNVSSANSTQVPVRITYKKGLFLNGRNPAVIEGYGGFGISGHFDPAPKAILLEFFNRGGVYIAPALRGGNELGEPWHEGGAGAKKQNVFNDLIAAAEYAIDRGFTSPEHLAVIGQSNGGLLVSAVAIQRPDLFRLAIPIAGVHDMLRKERLDPQFDDGWSWEYGSSDIVDDYKTLLAYSPLHNLKKQEYPTFLFVVGENDSRVNPAHSYKMAAALQGMQTGSSPILLSTYKNAGHWLNSMGLQGWIGWRVSVSIWSTIFDELGVPDEPLSNTP